MISIIIPDYIEGAPLQRCIDSIERQVYKEIEIIVIKDTGAGLTTSIDRCIFIKRKKDPLETLEKALNIAKGSQIMLLSCYSVLAPTVIQRLVNSVSKDILPVANEIVVDTKKTLSANIYSYNMIRNILIPRNKLKNVLCKMEKTYCADIFLHFEITKKIGNIKKIDWTYVYSTFGDIKQIDVAFDEERFVNTIDHIKLLDCNYSELIQAFIIQTFKADIKICELIERKFSDNYRLMVSFVLNKYESLYKAALRDGNTQAYNETKRFLSEIETKKDLFNIALERCDISLDMYSAMKYHDLDNYKFIVENKFLFKPEQNKNDYQELRGNNLVKFVISNYEKGYLGFRTIIKSISAWFRNKVFG